MQPVDFVLPNVSSNDTRLSPFTGSFPRKTVHGVQKKSSLAREASSAKPNETHECFCCCLAWLTFIFISTFALLFSAFLWHVFHFHTRIATFAFLLRCLALPSVCLFVCLSVFLSFCLSFCLSFRLSVCLSVRVCVGQFVCLSLRLFICLPVYLAVFLSVFLSFCLSVCLSVFETVSFFCQSVSSVFFLLCVCF